MEPEGNEFARAMKVWAQDYYWALVILGVLLTLVLLYIFYRSFKIWQIKKVKKTKRYRSFIIEGKKFGLTKNEILLMLSWAKKYHLPRPALLFYKLGLFNKIFKKQKKHLSPAQKKLVKSAYSKLRAEKTLDETVSKVLDSGIDLDELEKISNDAGMDEPEKNTENPG